MNLVQLAIVGVGCTLVPLFFDVAQTVLPRRLRIGRLVSAWHRQALLLLVLSLCGLAYYFFWESILPYAAPRAAAERWLHACAVSYLWLNACWAYGLCTSLSPPGPSTAVPLTIPSGMATKRRVAPIVLSAGMLR